MIPIAQFGEPVNVWNVFLICQTICVICSSRIEGRTRIHLLVYKPREDCIHHNGIQTILVLLYSWS